MTSASQSSAQRRGRIGLLVRWLAGLAVLALLIHFLPVAPLKSAFARIPLTRFVTVLLIYLVAHCFGIAKWRMVVNAAGAGLDYATSAQCYFGGLFGTLFLPSIIGGDVVRLAVGLNRSPRPAAVLTGNVADRFLDVMAQGALLLTGLLLLPQSVPDAVPDAVERKIWPAFWIALGTGGVLLILGVVLRKKLLGGRSVRFRRKLARLRHALRAVGKRPHALVLGWLMGTGIQFTLMVLTALLAMSCGLKLPLNAWLVAWPLAKLAAVLPLTQGGIGVREAALVALLAPFGAPGALVLAGGLAWEAVIIAGGLLAGGFAFVLGRGTENRRRDSAVPA